MNMIRAWWIASAFFIALSACGGSVQGTASGRVEAPDVAPLLGSTFRIERTFQEISANSRPTPVAKYAVIVPADGEEVSRLVERLRAHWSTNGALELEQTEDGYWLGSYREFILAFGSLDAFLDGDPHDEGVRKKTEGLDLQGVALVELTPR